jgi:hypothetical protein
MTLTSRANSTIIASRLWTASCLRAWGAQGQGSQGGQNDGEDGRWPPNGTLGMVCKGRKMLRGV